jgi:hypothetical protein
LLIVLREVEGHRIVGAVLGHDEAVADHLPQFHMAC